jgi:uncharacterized membrane protein
MTDLFLFVVTLAGAVLVCGLAAAIALLVVAVQFALHERRERVRLQRRARRAAQAYGLHLVAGSRDELADRRARRGGGRVA